MVAGSRTDRTAAGILAASAAAHGVLFVLLLRHLAATPEVATQPPVVLVELVPPWPSEVQRTPAASAPRRGGDNPTRQRPHRATSPESVLTGAPVAPGVGAADVRAVLQGLAGCDPRTTPRQAPAPRRPCEARLAAARPTDPALPRLDLSRGGAFAGRDPEPYLARKPKNGCKVRAGGRADAAGEEGAVAGVACAWSF